MKLNCYCVRNVLSGLSDGIFTYKTDGLASVTLAPMISRTTPLDEVQLMNIGTFDNETNELVPCSPVLVTWDSRRLVKESRADNVPVDKVENTIDELQITQR